MNKNDRSLDLSIFIKKDKSLDLSNCIGYEDKQNGGKRKSHSSSKVTGHKTDEEKLKYKREWYKKNATKRKDVKGYNKKYYEEHKEKLKLKRQSTKKK